MPNGFSTIEVMFKKNEKKEGIKIEQAIKNKENILKKDRKKE